MDDAFSSFHYWTFLGNAQCYLMLSDVDHSGGSLRWRRKKGDEAGMVNANLNPPAGRHLSRHGYDSEPFAHNRSHSGELLLSTVRSSAVQRGFFLPLMSTMTPTMPMITASTPSHAKASIVFLS
jgi:hypothetical protein